MLFVLLNYKGNKCSNNSLLKKVLCTGFVHELTEHFELRKQSALVTCG